MHEFARLRRAHLVAAALIVVIDMLKQAGISRMAFAFSSSAAPWPRGGSAR